MRTAVIERETKETSISLQLDLDGSGNATVDTGVGFMDHSATRKTFAARMAFSRAASAAALPLPTQ